MKIYSNQAGSSDHVDIRSPRRRNKRKAFYRDRTRGDGLAEISLENSTIAHLPALIRSPPMVLWLIEWGIFNFRSTLPHPARAAPFAPPTHACIRSTYSPAHLHRHPLHAHSHLPTSSPLPPRSAYYLIYPFPIRLPTVELPLCQTTQCSLSPPHYDPPYVFLSVTLTFLRVSLFDRSSLSLALVLGALFVPVKGIAGVIYKGMIFVDVLLNWEIE